MTDKHNIRAPAFYYELEAQDDDPFESEGPWTISGIAVGEDSVLRTDDGTPVLFSSDVLEAAAETQADKPLSVDHPTDEDGQPTFPPPSDETVGRVTDATYRPGKGLVYEATVHDPEIAKGIQAGSYEVSVHPVWKGFTDRDEATGAYVPSDLKFLDLSVVSHGMDRSNEAQIGPSTELLAWATQTDLSAELSASSDGGDDVDDPQGLIANTIEATLSALGHAPDDIDQESIDIGDEGAESSTETDTSSMNDNTREQYLKFLTANAGFDEESVESMDDDVLEQTYELAAEGAGADGDGGSTDPDDPDDDGGDDGPTTLADMTVDELGEALQEQGFVTKDNVGDLADEVTAQASKSEKVDEIIASADQYDEDDREDLMASADALVEREHDRVTGQSGMGLPASGGQITAAQHPTAGAGDSDEDLDEYGTGVADN